MYISSLDALNAQVLFIHRSYAVEFTTCFCLPGSWLSSVLFAYESSGLWDFMGFLSSIILFWNEHLMDCNYESIKP